MKKLVFLIAITVSQTLMAQNVGIGITTPNAKLSISVNGTELAGTAASNTLRTNAGTLGTTADSELSLANFGFLSASNSSLGIRAYRHTAGSDWTSTALLLGYDVDNTVRAGGGFISINANGNIGIGVANPDRKLEISGRMKIRKGADGEAGILLNKADNINIAAFMGLENDNYVGVYSPIAGWGLAMNTNTGDIKMMGKVGIGTVTPLQKLHVEGTTFLNGAVGIGIATPNASAQLDVSSTTKGFLPPRLTTAQRNAISSPATGLTIYNTSNKVLESFDGAAWAPSASIAHYIGESYGGGIVFYVYDNGQHGLIAATADQSTGIQWYNGTSRFTGTTGDGLSAGAMNTAMIVATQMADNQAGNFAAKVCADYSVTVAGVMYGDWYLPSKYELNLLFLQKDVVGGFATNNYWSSSEYDNFSAWLEGFNGVGAGIQVTQGKGVTFFGVRAVRAF